MPVFIKKNALVFDSVRNIPLSFSAPPTFLLSLSIADYTVYQMEAFFAKGEFVPCTK